MDIGWEVAWWKGIGIFGIWWNFGRRTRLWIVVVNEDEDEDVIEDCLRRLAQWGYALEECG